MITQTGLLPVEPPFVSEAEDLWRVIVGATFATAAAGLLVYCFQPLIKLTLLLFLLAG